MQILLALVLGFMAATAQADPGHWQGQQRAVVLLVEWKNQAARHTVAEVRDTFFGAPEGADRRGLLSLRDFFRENSAGRFDLTGDVRSWQVSQKTWNGRASCDLDSIVTEAWHLFSRSINITEYDTDHDGKIDNLFIVH